MLIAERILLLRDDNRCIEIPIRIYPPNKAEEGWICRFEIDWPEGRSARWGEGADSMQSLLIAMQMIGAEIYASHHHESGRLTWLAPRLGYGFPVPSNIRDLLVGDDARFL